MKPSKEEAMRFFTEHALPRRTRDYKAERVQFERGNPGRRYRLVQPNETDRGELIPVFYAGFKTLSQFGIGVALYYFQLLMLALIYFLASMIMTQAVSHYSSNSFGIVSVNPLVTISAACLPLINVTATVGCDSNSPSCIITYRPNCELPYNNALIDLVSCGMFVLVLALMVFIEQYLIKEIDEEVQSAQDYSIVVMDPTETADDPDEWYDFFSRFGTIKYITIFRDNNSLCDMISKKQAIIHKIQQHKQSEAQKQAVGIYNNRNFLSCFTSNATRKLLKLELKLEKINKKLSAMFLRSYRVNKVYVTFETEEYQRLCLKEMEIPDIDAMLDRKTVSRSRILFQGENVLNVKEPPEPDNIIWRNLAYSSIKSTLFRLFSTIFEVGILVMIYFFLNIIRQFSALVYAVFITIADSLLPMISTTLTDLSAPTSEGDRQNLLQQKLFLSRLLLSVIIPYTLISWKEFLTSQTISKLISIQLTTCFLGPILKLLDTSNIIKRHVLAPLLASNQAEMNSKFAGAEWTLAERYTNLSKLLFISLFYQLLTPLSLPLATVSYILTFFVDRFLLLRRWKSISKIDSEVAGRLSEQALIAILAHMYISLRFIYSWPMDEAYYDSSTQQYSKVNKFPSYEVWSYTVQPWHNEEQKRMLIPYKVCFLIVVCISLYFVIILPAYKYLSTLLCYEDVTATAMSQGVRFTDVAGIKAYIPIHTDKLKQRHLSSLLVNVKEKHIPSLVNFNCETKKLNENAGLSKDQ
eukprot:gene4353-6158_t